MPLSEIIVPPKSSASQCRKEPMALGSRAVEANTVAEFVATKGQIAAARDQAVGTHGDEDAAYGSPGSADVSIGKDSAYQGKSPVNAACACAVWLS